MRRTVAPVVVPLAALALCLSGCSGSTVSPQAGGTPSSTTSASSAPSSSVNSATKAACAKVQADLRSAPQTLQPAANNPQKTLTAARQLADRLSADVQSSNNAQLQQAVNNVAQLFRAIAATAATGSTTGLLADLQKIAADGRQVAEVCAQAALSG